MTSRGNSGSGKALVPLLGVVAALSMGVAAVGIVLLLQERDKSAAKERELVIVRAEKEDLRHQFDDLMQVKVRFEGELTSATSALEQTKQQLAEATASNMTLSKSVEDRQQEIDRLVKDLEQLRGERKQLTQELTNLQGQHSTLQQQVQSLEAAKGELESKVVELSERPTVELDKVVVGSAGGYGMETPVMPVSMGRGALQGQIIVVNRDYDFIVMNLGKNHGLSIGQEFQVLQGEQVLGTVKVEKVYDELAAAAILPGSNKEAIHEGDAVKAL